MLYLSNIAVNWVDGSTTHIPEYFEWRKDDTVEALDTTLLVKVEPKLFTKIEGEVLDISDSLLSQVYRKTIRINPSTKRKVTAAYIFILTDGERVLAVNTDGGSQPTLKSRLNTKDEIRILSLAEDMDTTYFDIPYFDVSCEDTPKNEQPDEQEAALEAKILKARAQHTVGLTRAEREMKKIILDCLIVISRSVNRAEVEYWYIELFLTKGDVPELQDIPNEQLVLGMLDFLNTGWGEQHREFGDNLVKYFADHKMKWIELNKETSKVES